jgi:hypothetical protein
VADHVSELDGIVAAIAHELLERVRELDPTRPE